MSIVVLFQGRSAQQQLCHNLANDDADTEVIIFLQFFCLYLKVKPLDWSC